MSHKMIFVNLPVQDLNRSVEFFTKLGYAFNPKFTDENATCMVLGENLFAMLLVKPFFQSFTPQTTIADATRHTEVLIALSVESRTAVDALMTKATAAGATEPRKPQDLGFMYQRAYTDLDGHQWEIMWMDPKAAE